MKPEKLHITVLRNGPPQHRLQAYEGPPGDHGEDFVAASSNREALLSGILYGARCCHPWADLVIVHWRHQVEFLEDGVVYTADTYDRKGRRVA